MKARVAVLLIVLASAGCSPVPARWSVGTNYDLESREFKGVSAAVYYDTPPWMLGK